jgi:hypothetical protein
MLFVVCCLLFVVCCLLFVVCCLLSTQSVSLIEGSFNKFWSVLGVDVDDLRGKVSE